MTTTVTILLMLLLSVLDAPADGWWDRLLRGRWAGEGGVPLCLFCRWRALAQRQDGDIKVCGLQHAHRRCQASFPQLEASADACQRSQCISGLRCCFRTAFRWATESAHVREGEESNTQSGGH